MSTLLQLLLTLWFFPSAQTLAQGRPPADKKAEAPALPRTRPAPDDKLAAPAKPLQYHGRLEGLGVASHLAPFAGRVKTRHVLAGERVRKGQKLLTLARLSVGEIFIDYPLVSNINGIIQNISVIEGQEFSTGHALVQVIDDSKRIIKLSISDKDRLAIQQAPEITVQYMQAGASDRAERRWKGSVYQFAPNVTEGTGLYMLEIEVVQADTIPLGRIMMVSFLGKAS